MKKILIKTLLICGSCLLFSDFAAGMTFDYENGGINGHTDTVRILNENEIRAGEPRNFGNNGREDNIDVEEVDFSDEPEVGEEDLNDNRIPVGNNERRQERLEIQNENPENPNKEYVRERLDRLYDILDVTVPTTSWETCVFDLLEYQLKVEGTDLTERVEQKINEKIDVYGVGLVRSQIVSGDLILEENPDSIGGYRLTEREKNSLNIMKVLLKSADNEMNKSVILDLLADFYLKCLVDNPDEWILEEEEGDEALRRVLEGYNNAIDGVQFDEANPYRYAESRVRTIIDKIGFSLPDFELNAEADLVAVSALISSQLGARAAAENRSVKDQLENEVQIFGISVVNHLLMLHPNGFERGIVGRRRLTTVEEAAYNALFERDYVPGIKKSLDLFYLYCLLNSNMGNEQ